MKRKSQAILKIMLTLLLTIILLKLCLIFLWPFFLSLMMVLIIEPLVKSIMKFGVKRKVSVIISYMVFFIAMGTIVFYISDYAYSSIISFFHKLPHIIEVIGERFEFINYGKINYNSFIGALEEIISGYRSKILGTVLSTVNGFVYGFIVLITSFFISIDLNLILGGVERLVSRNNYIALNNIITKVSNIILLEFKLVFATTIQTVLGLYVLGVREALTIGIICGILDILPVIGPTIVFVPWILYEFVIKNYFLSLGLLALFILLQINREIMHIKLVGNNLKIRPVAAIFALYIGIIMFGIWGVILGPLMIVITQELFRSLATDFHA